MENGFDYIIESGKTEKQYIKDVWKYRELFYFLSWKDILVRYKQTVIGILWAILRPLLTMLVFTLVFGKIAKLPSQNIPYPILVFSALLPWQFFANALSESSNSLISNSNMISKIYFPRIIIPISSVIVAFVDFLISLGILAVLMIIYGFVPQWQIIFLPVFALMVFIISTGAGMWLAALNVKYRDFRYVVPFIVQFGLYISPVGFNSSLVPEKWRLIYSLNPMVGIIDGFRWLILGDKNFLYMPGLIMSIAIAILLFLFGLRYFRNTERFFADVI